MIPECARAASKKMAKISGGPISQHALTVLDCPRWQVQDCNFGSTKLH